MLVSSSSKWARPRFCLGHRRRQSLSVRSKKHENSRHTSISGTTSACLAHARLRIRVEASTLPSLSPLSVRSTRTCLPRNSNQHYSALARLALDHDFEWKSLVPRHLILRYIHYATRAFKRISTKVPCTFTQGIYARIFTLTSMPPDCLRRMSFHLLSARAIMPVPPCSAPINHIDIFQDPRHLRSVAGLHNRSLGEPEPLIDHVLLPATTMKGF